MAAHMTNQAQLAAILYRLSSVQPALGYSQKVKRPPKQVDVRATARQLDGYAATQPPLIGHGAGRPRALPAKETSIMLWWA